MTLDKNRIIDAIVENNGRLSDAAREIGCAVSTIYYHRDKHKDVAEAIDDARETHDVSLLDLSETKLREHVEDGKPWAIKYVLSTIGKSRGYTTKQEVQHHGAKQIIMQMDLGIDPNHTDEYEGDEVG